MQQTSSLDQIAIEDVTHKYSVEHIVQSDLTYPYAVARMSTMTAKERQAYITDAYHSRTSAWLVFEWRNKRHKVTCTLQGESYSFYIAKKYCGSKVNHLVDICLYLHSKYGSKGLLSCCTEAYNEVELVERLHKCRDTETGMLHCERLFDHAINIVHCCIQLRYKVPRWYVDKYVTVAYYEMLTQLRELHLIDEV